MSGKSKKGKRRPIANIVGEVLEAIGEAQSFTKEMSFQHFLSDKKTCRAVERCLEIISEASRHIPEKVRARFPEVPWRNVVDSGNIFRHAYHAVSVRIVWDTVHDELPTMKRVMETLRAELTAKP